METDKLYNIKFLKSALDDMTEVVSTFLMNDCPNGAVRIKQKMTKAAQQVARFPSSGAIVPDAKLAKKGYRMIIVEKYLMFYRVFEDEQEIVFYRVLNGTVNYPNLLRKISSDL